MRSAIRRPTLPARRRRKSVRWPHRCAKYLADDAVFRFANADEVIGRDNIEAALGAFYDSIKALSHERQGLYEVDDTSVVWSDVTYTKFDDSQLTVPVVTIVKRNDDGLIVDYRIFMDAAPLFA